MAKKTALQQRLTILEKIISIGVTTEEDVKKLTPNDVAKIEGISFADILLICELQESIKNGKLFTFLTKTENQ